MVALLLTVFMLLTGLVIDEGFWTIASTRLQVAADSAAMGASLTLASSAFQAQNAATQQTNLNTVAQFEASAAATKLVGTMQAPTVTYDSSKYSWVKVVLKSQAPSFFSSAVNVSAPLLTASATVSTPKLSNCALTLGSTGMGVEVDNGSTLTATNCNIMSDSASNPSIYLNSGTIAATGNGTINAVGSITKSNSGTNTLTPSPGNTGVGSVSDPFVAAGKTVPSYGTCANYTGSSFILSANKAFDTATQNVFCGGLYVNGNGSWTISFAPGIYYIVNGDLTLAQAHITSASGVTFVITGSSPGSFQFTDYSGSSTLTAPTSGPTAGIAIWVVCNTTTTKYFGFTGGATMNMGGTIYAPCTNATLNSGTSLIPVSGNSLNLITSNLYVTGGSTLTLSGGAAAASTQMMLSQ